MKTSMRVYGLNATKFKLTGTKLSVGENGFPIYTEISKEFGLVNQYLTPEVDIDNYVEWAVGVLEKIWPMYGNNPQHTGRSIINTPKNYGNKLWEFAGGGEIIGQASVSADGTIYFGSSDHYVYAVNSDGTLKWKYKTGDAVCDTPSISPDGEIYVGSWDKYIYALNADGTLKWKYLTGGRVGASILYNEGGTIYAGSDDGYVYALTPDGTLKWKYNVGGHVNWAGIALGLDGTIYVAVAWGGNLYALNPDGSLKWKYEETGQNQTQVSIGPDGTIYWTIGGGPYYLCAVNPDGTEKWRYPMKAEMFVPASIGGDGTVYFSSLDWNIYAISPDGVPKWIFNLQGQSYAQPVISSDGTIYVGALDGGVSASNGHVFALNPNGTVVWKKDGLGRVRGISINADGTLYVTSGNGMLYALR